MRKFYGNQLPFELNVDPTVMIDAGSNIVRGFDINGANTDPGATSISVTDDASLFTTDVTFTTDASTYTYFNVDDASLLPPCGDSTNSYYSIYCKSFVKIADTGALPNFIKFTVTIDGSSYDFYTPSPKGLPEADDFPSFTNASGATLCGTSDTSTYPSALNFSIPDGHSVDGFSLGPVMATTNSMDFGSFDWDAAVANLSAPLTWSSGGAIVVTEFNVSVSSLDESGISFKRIFSCK